MQPDGSLLETRGKFLGSNEGVGDDVFAEFARRSRVERHQVSVSEKTCSAYLKSNSAKKIVVESSGFCDNVEEELFYLG